MTGGGLAAGGSLPHRQVLVVLMGLMCSMFLAALDQSVITVALPRIVSDIGVPDQLAWVLTAYLIASTASTPLWGKVSDLWGRRPLFPVAGAVFLAGSVLAGSAGGMAMLLLGRGLQGIGGGGLIALSLAIIGDIIPSRERGRYQAYLTGCWTAAGIVGPLLGGWLVERAGWRWIFFLNLPIGLAGCLVTWLALRRMPTVTRDRNVDYPGAGLMVLTVTSGMLLLSWAGPQRGWASPMALGLTVIFGLALASFLLVETRAVNPLLPLRLFRRREYTCANVYSAVMGVGSFGVLVFVPIHLQVVRGIPPTQAGALLIPFSVAIFLASMVVGRITSRRDGGTRRYLVVGSLLTAAGFLLLAQATRTTPLPLLAAVLLVLGCGLGLAYQVVMVTVQTSVPRADLGVGTAAVTFFRTLGAAVGTAGLGAVFSAGLDNSGSAGASATAIDPQHIARLPAAAREAAQTAVAAALDTAFLVAVPVMLLGTVMAVLVQRQVRS